MDWLILTCKSMKRYFMSGDKGIGFIVRLYLHFGGSFFKGFFFHTVLSNTNNLFDPK